MSYRRRNLVNGGSSFNPAGVVSGWLSNTTVGLISSVPDLLDPSGPATSATTLRPTGNADGSMTFDGGDRLLWGLKAANNGDVNLGVAFHYKPISITGTQCLVSVSSPFVGGASGPKFEIEQSAATIRARVHLSSDQTIDRRFGTVSAAFTIGVPVFVYFFYAGGGATEALKCVFALGTTFQTVAFAQEVATAAAMPATLQTVTGNMSIGARAAGSNPVQAGGIFGQDFYSLTSPLSAASLANLAAFRPLT
jgi:hypothetical protein